MLYEIKFGAEYIRTVSIKYAMRKAQELIVAGRSFEMTIISETTEF